MKSTSLLSSTPPGGILIAALLILFAGYIYIKDNFGGPSIIINDEKQFVLVEGDPLVIEYNFSEQQTYVEGIAVHYKKSSGDLRNLGGRFEIGIVSEAQYERFLELTRQGTCPANFLNQNSDNFVLIPHADDVSAAISSSKVKQGSKVFARGRPLTVSYAEHNGREMSSFNLSGFQILLVDEFLKEGTYE